MLTSSPLPAPTELDAGAARFGVASRELQGQRDLLRRIDTKFICRGGAALAIIARLAEDYAALPVAAGTIATYRSLYFDTADLRCYHDHRRGRRPRQKVRIRHYPDRRLTFLEVKTKRHEVVTDKQRLALAFHDEALGATAQAFLRRHVRLPVEDLHPTLRIDFRRLSLVGLRTPERVTIDWAVEAERLDGGRWSFGPLVVIEVKQAPFCLRTPAMRAVFAAGLRAQAMSKYTITTALMRPHLRRNRLLADMRAIERMLP